MKITLCGSTRFKDEFVRYNTELSLRGHVVYSIAWAKEDESSAGSGIKMDEKTKQNLDLVHLAKILNSDMIVIVSDGSNYVGDSTRREIVWAQMNGKAVAWGLKQLIENWVAPVDFQPGGY